MMNSVPDPEELVTIQALPNLPLRLPRRLVRKYRLPENATVTHRGHADLPRVFLTDAHRAALEEYWQERQPKPH